jgi:hypothetical protein
MNIKELALSDEFMDSFEAVQDFNRYFQYLKDKASKWEPNPYVSPDHLGTVVVPDCGCDGRGI